MENEEKKNVCCGEDKKGCCENKDGSKCDHSMSNCCHNWKKCHMMRKIIWIVFIVIAFCLGSQWGEMKSEFRGSRFERGGMMNWGQQGRGYDRYNQNPEQATDGVTVEVTKNPTPGATPIVPVTPKQ